jgi:hypothetical protein
MLARTDALISQQETGKIAASTIPRYGRLSPGVYGNPTRHGSFGSTRPVPTV